jgi:CRISPR-associated endonuclease/helicase Cas3
MCSSEDIIYRYWGKARPDEGKDPVYHLLPYHCLDVAAVGEDLIGQKSIDSYAVFELIWH